MTQQFNFPTPDFTEVNESLNQILTALRGLKMYSEAEINEIKARAFDEGFTASAAERTKQRKDPTHPITRINPYKGQ